MASIESSPSSVRVELTAEYTYPSNPLDCTYFYHKLELRVAYLRLVQMRAYAAVRLASFLTARLMIFGNNTTCSLRSIKRLPLRSSLGETNGSPMMMRILSRSKLTMRKSCALVVSWYGPLATTLRTRHIPMHFQTPPLPSLGHRFSLASITVMAVSQ